MVVRYWGLLFSGNANNDTNAGFVYANTNNTASNANTNISSQLCLLYIGNPAIEKATQAQYQQSICSWWGWCKHCDSVNLVNNILKKVPYEIKF